MTTVKPITRNLGSVSRGRKKCKGSPAPKEMSKAGKAFGIIVLEGKVLLATGEKSKALVVLRHVDARVRFLLNGDRQNALAVLIHVAQAQQVVKWHAQAGGHLLLGKMR